jgi:predicted transcriptional regulator
VQEEIERGHYRSLEGLLAEGLRVLRERETFIGAHRDELRAQIAEGVAQAARGELVDGEEAMERLRRTSLGASGRNEPTLPAHAAC